MFGNILHDILINKPYYSISAFAKDIGISAGLLNHIFNGKRTISSDKFALTLANHAFTYEEKQKLKKAYFSDRYGEEMYRNIQLFHNTVQTLEFDNSYAVSCEQVDFSKEISVFEDEKTLVCAVKKIFSEAGDCVYTNIPHKKDRINNILFSLKKECAETELCRIITGFDDSFSQESLTAMFSIIRFARIGVPTVSLDNKEVLSLYGSTIFPYYVISDKALILTDGRFKGGIAVFAESFLREKYGSVKRKFSSCKKAVKFFSSEVEMTNYIISNEGDELYALGYSPCFIAQNDISYLESILSFETADKNEIIGYLKQWTASKKWTSYTTLDGIWDFLHHNKYYNTANVHIKNIGIPAKIRFLESLIDTIENSKDYSHNYLKSDCSFSSFIKDINIKLDDELLVLTTTFESVKPEGFMGQVCLTVDKGEMYRTVSLYLKDYLPASGDLITDSAAKNAISAMIIECKRK